MNNNYCVIMSGGVGGRFWPISREKKPKQFVDFFGTGRSLLQETFARFRKIIPADHIFVVTHLSYTEQTREQLPELPPENILSEPHRRNTAPCIAFASYYIRKLNPDARIVVAASDHLILDTELFTQNILTALDFAGTHPYLVTLGIKPTRAETGYGYIQAGKEQSEGFFHVKAFTEKPGIDMARIFVESGEFLWNSGMFVWHVNSIIAAFEEYMPDLAQEFTAALPDMGTPHQAEAILKVYAYSSALSIDYGIMEKSHNVLVYPVQFGWADLGTWGSLYDLSRQDAQGNVTPNSTNALFYEAHRNIVNLDDPRKVAVIQGLDDYIVAQRGNALLICKKSEEQRIKSFVFDVKLKFGDDLV